MQVSNQNTGNDWEPFWQNVYKRNFWSQLGHKCWSRSMRVSPCSMNDFGCSCIQSYVLELCSYFLALLPFWETRVSFLTDAGGNWILLIKVQLRTSFHKGEKNKWRKQASESLPLLKYICFLLTLTFYLLTSSNRLVLAWLSIVELIIEVLAHRHRLARESWWCIIYIITGRAKYHVRLLLVYIYTCMQEHKV